MTTIGFKRPEHDHDDIKELQMPPQDFRHTLITGATGSGKTASLILPILQNRIATNNSIIFLEYKGHEHRKIKYMARQMGRLNDIVEIGKPTGSYINIMNLFDRNMLKDAIFNLCGGHGKDPYWSTSASQLAIRVIELQRKLHQLSQLLIDKFDVPEDFFTLKLSDALIQNNDYHMLKISEEISFSTLAKIVHKPSSLIHFFSSIRDIAIKIEIIINNLYKKPHDNLIKANKLHNLLSEFIIFREKVDKYADFSIQETDEAGGNNGVLQILQNAISTLAVQDYINKDEIDILKLLDNNAIIIIDVQSLNSDIYGIFIESTLKKLSARIKYKIPSEVSIFIDEANRILTPNLDLHNDILRESRVELILASQNEEQMQIKFGETAWESIVSNIQHHYAINERHMIWYNGTEQQKVTPLLFDEIILDNTEYIYNRMPKNIRNITNRFTFNNSLPTSFKIIYDIHAFFQDSTLDLKMSDGKTTIIKYVGEDVKNKTKNKIESYKKNLLQVSYT